MRTRHSIHHGSPADPRSLAGVLALARSALTRPRLVVAALLFLGLLGLPAARIARPGRLVSSWMTRTPRIDGQIAATEWSEATSLYIGGGVSVWIGNDSRALYVAVWDGVDSIHGTGDQLALLFDDEGGVPPIVEDGSWSGAACQQNSTLGEGALFFTSDQNVSYQEYAGGYCPAQAIRGRASFRSVVLPDGVRYETAIPLDGAAPLRAGPGQMLGLFLLLYRDGGQVACLPNCGVTDVALFRNLILASGGCNTGPQGFESGLPLDWAKELVSGSGQGWVQSLPPFHGDAVFCQSNDTGGAGAAACVANVLHSTPATAARLHLPLSLAGQTSARIRLRATLVVDPNGSGPSDGLAIDLRRQDGTVESVLSWLGQDQSATVDLPLSLAGSPPVELWFTHATVAGGTEGGFAQIDDVELLCEPVLADGFESGDTSAWSEGTTNACKTPTGGPTLHANSILANETWTANAGPHILTGNVLVPPGVTLTLAPCAEVRVRPGFDLTIQGSLIARGTSQRHIAFRRDNPALAWDSIWIKSPGFADLAFVDVTGGGAAGASVLAEGVDTLPPVLPLRADHLSVVGSTSYGVRLFRRAGFAVGSEHLVVSGSGATDPAAPFPVRMSLNTVGTLPTGTYTGNASDLIQVVGEGNSAVEVDDTFHDRGVPYQIGGPAGAFGLLIVDGDPSLATLTIEQGVEMRFYTSGSNIGGLFVGTSGSPVATGRIVAAGTAAAPILFTRAGGGGLGRDHVLRRTRGGQRARSRSDRRRGRQRRRRRLRLPAGFLPGDLRRAQDLQPAGLTVLHQLHHLALEHARRLSGLDGRERGLPRRQRLHRRRLLPAGAAQTAASRRLPSQSGVPAMSSRIIEVGWEIEARRTSRFASATGTRQAGCASRAAAPSARSPSGPRRRASRCGATPVPGGSGCRFRCSAAESPAPG